MTDPIAIEDRHAPRWVLPVFVGVGYLLFAQSVGWFAPTGTDGPTFWPAAGLALGALLVTERRRWPAILLAAFIAESISNALMDHGAVVVLGWAAANALHPWVAAACIRRLHPEFRLASLPELGAFVLFGGIVGPLVSASIGTLAGVAALGRDLAGLPEWWVGDGLGALVVAPLFVAWRRRSWRGRPGWERTLTYTGVLGVTALVFADWPEPYGAVLPYLVLPPLVWCALRFGVSGAAAGIGIVGLVGGWWTSMAYGPFAGQTTEAKLLFDIYLIVLIATTLLVGVLRTSLVAREQAQAAAEARREAVEEVNEELTRAVDLREQLVSMVSHELRGPLTPILGFTSALQRTADRQRLSDEQRAAVDAIQRNASRMLAMIEELLVSARVAAGELTAEPGPVDVRAEVERALDEQLGRDDVVLAADDDDSPRVAMVEKGHLNQILVNLVNNARKYGRPPIELRIDGHPDAVALEVADHGAGVEDDLVPVMFERFTRADGPSGDGIRDGVGLGLAIVKLLAEANDGTVTYRPKSSAELSAFIATFPAAVPDRLPE